MILPPVALEFLPGKFGKPPDDVNEPDHDILPFAKPANFEIRLLMIS
jgi:hypothetical protein